MKSTESGSFKTDPQSRRNNKNLIIGVLSVALFAMSLFFILDKSKSSNDNPVVYQEEGVEPVASMTTEEVSDLRKSFDETLVRIDSLTDANEKLKTELSERNQEITDKKAEIRRILNGSNTTKAELSKAKELIASLNETITGLEEQVAALTQDKNTLIMEKEALVQENQQLNTDLAASTELNVMLTEKVDIGSTLNASNINIIPMKIKKNDKEKVTHTAKRVDKFMITFDVNNRIAEPGMKDLFVTVTGPDGKLITSNELGSGTFVTREQGMKEFTTQVAVELETTKKKLVEFSFEPKGDFIEGNYQVRVYQNGFMIGEGVTTLKKGGLFG